MLSKISKLKKQFKLREKYCSGSRNPFYQLAGKYLPEDTDSYILDIGSGVGGFADYLSLKNKYKNLFLLDGNRETIEILKKKDIKNALFYKAPNKLPFNNESVDYIHSSHLIEHLGAEDLYVFLMEIDRVLKGNGVLVISTPMLWQRFYDDLSHVRPYNHNILINYFCPSSDNHTQKSISDKYRVLDLVFRYRVLGLDQGWGAKYFFLELLIKFLKMALNKIGIRKYIKNGFTIALCKGFIK